MARTALAVCLFASALAGFAGYASTEPSALIGYQGVLRDADNRAIDGSVDMIFRFHNSAAGGDEVLVDRHTAALGGAVGVAEGLFAVQLGAGAIQDGSGPGDYASLGDVFRDHRDIWMSVQIGEEVLSPRTRLLVSGRALNADRLGGRDAASYAQVGAANVFTGGEQTIRADESSGRALVVEGVAGSSGNLTEWRTANGAVVASVSPDGVIAASGAGLTGLDASTLASGVVADERLDPRVTRDAEWDSTAKINAATLDDDFVTAGGSQAIEGAKRFEGNVSTRVLNAVRHSSRFDGVQACLVDLPETGGMCIADPDEDDPVPFADANPDLVPDSLVVDRRGGRMRFLTTKDYPSNLATVGPDDTPFVIQPRWNDGAPGGWDCGATGTCAVGYGTSNYWYTGSCNMGDVRCGGLPIFQVRAPQEPGSRNGGALQDRPIFSVGRDGVDIYMREDNQQQASLAIHYPSTAAYAKGGKPMYVFTNGGLFADGDLTLAHPGEWPEPFNAGTTWRTHFMSQSNDVLAMWAPGEPNFSTYIESTMDSPDPAAITGFMQFHDRQFGQAAHCRAHPCGPRRFRWLADGSHEISGRWFDTTTQRYPGGRPALNLDGAFRSADTSGTPVVEALRIGTTLEAAHAGASAIYRGLRVEPAISGTASGNSIPEWTAALFRPRIAGSAGASIGTLAALRTGADLGAAGGWSAASYVGLLVEGPSAPIGGTIGTAHGVYVNDLGGFGAAGAAIAIAPQSGGDPTRGNLRFDGGRWNDGHLVLGTAHVWSDAAGSIRVDQDAPLHDGDGGALVLDVTEQTISGAKNFENRSNRFVGDGSGLTEVSAATLDGLEVGAFLRSDVSDAFTSGTLVLEPGTTLEVRGEARLAGSLLMAGPGTDRDQSIFFLDAGEPTAESFAWDDARRGFSLSDDLAIDGELNTTGTSSFVQNDPTDATQSIAFTALGGDEAGTYTRGTGRLADGVAEVALGAPFARSTNPDIGLTAHLTARGAGAALFVESLSSDRLVVRAAPGTAENAAFDYVVFGLRAGYERSSPIRERHVNAPVPSEAAWDRLHEARPELEAFSPLARFREMEVRVRGRVASDDRGRSLRRSIGEHERDLGSAAMAVPLETAKGTQAPARGEVLEASALPRLGDPDPDRAPVEDLVRRVAGTEQGVREFLVLEPVESGDVVVADTGDPSSLRRGASAEDPGVVGVVVRDSSFTAGVAPVALVGIVRCKADAAWGPIRRGDLLAVSPNPGHAMSSRRAAPGTIVGKALEPLDDGTGKILVLVTPR